MKEIYQKMSKVHCKICNRDFISKESWQQHCGGEKHFKLLPNNVTIKGFFNIDKVSEVHKYFEKYGTIKSSTVTQNDNSVSITYTFQQKGAYNSIIHEKHTISNKPVEISWMKPLQKPHLAPTKQPGLVVPKPGATPAPKKNTPQAANKVLNMSSVSDDFVFLANSDATIKAALEALVANRGTLDEQVKLLQNQLQPDCEKMLNNRNLILHDITMTLSGARSLAKGIVQFFGSSMTDLGLINSDVDIYIGNLTNETRCEVATLKEIRRLLFKSRKFCDILLIPNASVPIIKCIHSATKICCDVNIRNRLAVCNTQLIKYYLNLNVKLRPLVIAIKFWADLCGIKQVNFLSSYAIYMMIIFYLQQEPYNLPPVYQLQKDCPADLEDGWNCAFRPLSNYSNDKLKNATMIELISGFFIYYSKFDYFNLVICPFAGVPIKKVCFIKPYQLPDFYMHYKNSANEKQTLNVHSSICIQDPFEHARNISAATKPTSAGKFPLLCSIASDAFKMTPLVEKNLLSNIIKKCQAFNLQTITFILNKVDCVCKQFSDNEWIKMVDQLVLKIIKEILVSQINDEPIKSASNIKNYKCLSLHNIWENRIQTKKLFLTELPPETNDIDIEITTSQWIVKHFPLHRTTKYTIQLTFKENPCRVEIRSLCFGKSKYPLYNIYYLRLKLEEWLKMSYVEEENLAQTGTNLRKLAANDEMIKQEDKVKIENEACSSGNLVSVNDSTEVFPSNGDNNANSVDKMKTVEEGELANDEDEEEEDVPPDFFDDFSNQDFMDGLDIVDAWDDESGKLPDEEPSKEVIIRNEEKKKPSPIHFDSISTDKRSSKTSTDKYRHSGSPKKWRRPSSKSRSRDRIYVSDLRRDPEKTKRDINRDKIKCARDKEQKLVSDKLKLVETGLVPPGTEMECDIKSFDKTQEKRRSSGSSSHRAVRVERDRKYIRRSGSSEGGKVIRYSRTPPSHKSRIRQKESQVTYHSRKRTASIESNASDREMWIRSAGRKRSRSRESFSRCKIRKYEDRKYEERKYEEKKKKSFLEEIREKLNEVRVPPAPIVQYSHHVMPSYNPNPQQHPIPAPVPAPHEYFPQNNPAGVQQYDRNFFIGENYPLGQPQNLNYNNMIPTPANVVPIHPLQMSHPIQPQTSPSSVNIVQNNTTISSPPIQNTSVAKINDLNDTQTIEDIDKLFADKKISLSDFLTITAKCEVQSSTPEHLQKKIKVISRCQDAIRILSDDRKFTGRLTVKPSSAEMKNKLDVKYQSPLRRIPIIRFQFTTPMKGCEDADGFSTALNVLLQKIGLIKDSTILEELSELTGSQTVSVNTSVVDEDTLALTKKASLLVATKKTDSAGCDECLKRKLKIFTDVGSQCATTETISIGIQVNEEELTSTKSLLKNESIAFLTPAQLLGKEKEKEEVLVETPKTTPEKVKHNEESPKSKLHQSFETKPGKFSPFRGRGRGFQKPVRERPYPPTYEMDEFEYYDRGIDYEDTFGGRPSYGGYPRPYINQFREEENILFTDFHQTFRGRNANSGRYGGPPRY